MKQTKGRIDADTAELCGYAKNIGYVSLKYNRVVVGRYGERK